jgi:hypothetical protein
MARKPKPKAAKPATPKRDQWPTIPRRPMNYEADADARAINLIGRNCTLLAVKGGGARARAARVIQMNTLVSASLVALATAGPPAAHAAMSPAAFDQFPAQSVYTGKRAPPNVATGWAHLFRTRITAASKDKPNFAGQYVITEWGCGTGCGHGAVVNLKTGEAMPLPGPSILNLISGFAGDPYEFQLNSRLLVVNTNEDFEHAEVHTRCYELRNKLGRDSLAAIDCPRAPQ